jgi:hypothetical protein
MDPQALRDLIREIEMQGLEFEPDDNQPPRFH